MQNYKKQKTNSNINSRLEYQELIHQKKWEEAYSKLKQILDSKKSQTVEITSRDFSQLCQLCNYIAMISLKQSNYDLVVEYLQKAQKYCKYSSYLTLITFNNWGCYFKKTNNHSLALLYMNKAISIAKSIKSFILHQRSYQKIRFLADCHLNLCAILSNMNQHQMALQNACTAVKYIQNELHQFEKQQIRIDKINDRHNVLIIAKFNMAVELQYLKRYFQSLKSYKSLRDYIFTNFNTTHSMLKTVDKAIDQLQNKLKRRKSSLKFDFLDKSDKQNQQKKSYFPLLVLKQVPCQNGRRSSLSNHKDKELNKTQRRKRSVHNKLVLNRSSRNHESLIQQY